MTFFNYPTAEEYSYDGIKISHNPNTQISFFSDTSLTKEISHIKHFNQTRMTFVKKYQDNIKSIKHNHHYPQCRLIKESKVNNQQLSSLPRLIDNENELNEASSSIDISKEAIQQFKSYIDKETETSWYSPPYQSKKPIKEKESKLYQKIFRNKKEKQEMILKAFKRNRGITNTSESRELPIDKNKYSLMTRDTIKDAKEKMHFLKGVINYVFPKYLHYKIEPYMTANYFYKLKLAPRKSTVYSQTFYTNSTTTTKPKTISMLNKQYFPIKRNKGRVINYGHAVQLTC